MISSGIGNYEALSGSGTLMYEAEDIRLMDDIRNHT